MWNRTVVVLAGLAGLLGTAANPAPVPPREAARDNNWIGGHLQKQVEIPGIDDPKVTLAEALELLGKAGEVKIGFNHKALRQAGCADLDKTEIAAVRPVPGRKGKLGIVLRELLEHIASEGDRGPAEHLGFLVRSDRLEILPETALRKEVWNQNPDEEPTVRFFPLVHLKATERPVKELFDAVADQSELTVLVDPRCGDKTNREVTVKLVNLPADSAVELLADMAGLEMVLHRNALYVTTAENAGRIRREQERKQGIQINPFPGGWPIWPGGWPVGPMLPGMGPGAPADPAQPMK